MAYFIMWNANSADVMPCVVTHAMNHNDVMCSSCDMCMPVSWISVDRIPSTTPGAEPP